MSRIFILTVAFCAKFSLTREEKNDTINQTNQGGRNFENFIKYYMVFIWRHLAFSCLDDPRPDALHHDNRHPLRHSVLQDRTPRTYAIWQKGQAEFPKASNSKYTVAHIFRLGISSPSPTYRNSELHHNFGNPQRHTVL